MKNLFVLFLFIGMSSFSQQTLPNITIQNTEGKTLSLKTDCAEKDKLYVFSFWATWCAPCVQELDAISDVYDDWKKKSMSN